MPMRGREKAGSQAGLVVTAAVAAIACYLAWLTM